MLNKAEGISIEERKNGANKADNETEDHQALVTLLKLDAALINGEEFMTVMHMQGRFTKNTSPDTAKRELAEYLAKIII